MRVGQPIGLPPYLETTDPFVRLTWRAIIERMVDLDADDDKRRAVLIANKIALSRGAKSG